MRFTRTLPIIALISLATALPLASVTPAYAETKVSETVSIDSEEWAFLPLINKFREKHDVAPLQVSKKLTIAAEWMSNDMADENYFSHTDSQDRSMKERINSFGYTGTMGENIAAGQISAEEVFKAWENSPGHRENMLRPEFKVIGISRVLSGDTKYNSYWTTDFGGTVDSVISENEKDLSSTEKRGPEPKQTTKQRTRRTLSFNWSDWLSDLLN